MLGLIITGHGKFATGLLSAIELIAGEQENLVAVDFEEEDSAEILTDKIQKALNEVNTGEGAVILTDIPGGTPFKQSVLLSRDTESVKVVSGTNLPSIMENLFNRGIDVDSFTDNLVGSGKNGFLAYEEKLVKSEENSDSDGI